MTKREAILELLARHGIVGSDAETALRTYERDIELHRPHGSDSSRVAAVMFAETGFGGTRYAVGGHPNV